MFVLTAYAQISAATEDATPSTDELFELLKKTLLEYNLMYKLSQIYTGDELGMPLEHKLRHVIAGKKIGQVTSGNKTQITILGCLQCYWL